MPPKGLFIVGGVVGALAPMLEERKVIRNRVLKDSQITAWLNPKAVGVKSVKAMGLNSDALEVIANWWCPHFSIATALRIGYVRSEAHVHPTTEGLSHVLVFRVRSVKFT